MDSRKRKGTELQIPLETTKSLKHALVDVSKFQFGENIHSKTKRTRASIICDGCKGSKKKCEGWDQNTPCRTCVRKGIECILPPHCTSCRRKKLDSTGICPECKSKESHSENIHARDYAAYQQIQALEERVRMLEVNLEKSQILEANLEKFKTLETTINKLAAQQFDKPPKDNNNVNILDGEPDLSKYFTFEV
ncbi:276_t:CDS:2 [Dentiscutata erythropus]|uniref:276_t:CDS:1 n=1 Tax=Dentiscutata erythropus TaxID=1348616 RepID=A0A9N9N754_9GLOM|nr:276_t:CDS:2 [Dentiscutata erythropus]